MVDSKKNYKFDLGGKGLEGLTLYTLTSVCTFSILFSLRSLRDKGVEEGFDDVKKMVTFEDRYFLIRRKLKAYLQHN